jgi:RNA polymerase sigma-70 factor (ECF subfamily)
MAIGRLIPRRTPSNGDPMDMTTFANACAAHRQSLLAYAFTCCGDLGLAEDIVQEAHLIALRKRDRCFSDADFGAWLIAIARNVWFRERDRRRIADRASRFLHDHANDLLDREGFDGADLDQERAALRICIGKLAVSDCDLLRAHFAEGLKYHEIAVRFGRTLSWVKVRMFRVRAALLICVTQAMRRSEQKVKECRTCYQLQNASPPQ